MVEVVKFGGSLLSRADYSCALAAWLSAQPAPVHRVFVVGGGEPVEALRRVDARYPMGAEAAHWRAISLMQENARCLGDQLPQLVRAETLARLRARLATPGNSLLLPEAFLREEEPYAPGTPLPTGWHVTSDSIAARLAVLLGARRLRLLKSRSPSSAELCDWNVASRRGLVDPFFPRLAGDIPQVTCELLPPLRHEVAERKLVDIPGAGQLP